MTLSDFRRGISGPRVPKISDENFRSHAPKPFCPSDHFGLLVVTCIEVPPKYVFFLLFVNCPKILENASNAEFPDLCRF